MADDARTEGDIFEVITHWADTRNAPAIMMVTALCTPDELIDTARQMANRGEVTDAGDRPREVLAVINGLPVARFLARWTWDHGDQTGA